MKAAGWILALSGIGVAYWNYVDGNPATAGLVLVGSGLVFGVLLTDVSDR